VLGAAASLSMLSPVMGNVGESGVGSRESGIINREEKKLEQFEAEG
jgi:hypothetical protein